MKRTCMLAVMFLFAFACDSGADDDEVGETPTGASCPDVDPPTYDNFGQAFMEAYCTRCHSSSLSGSDRLGAPSDHDFDTLAGVLQFAEHVDENAASGPDATNTQMPPSGASPTAAERERLGEWLACETQ